MSTNLQCSIGQRLCIKTKHDIELDKTFDKGDEMIDDNHYFNCKESGLFVPASETNIMNESENDSNVSTVFAKDFNFPEKMPHFFKEQICNLPVLSLSGDLLPAMATISSDKSVLNHSYTISKELSLIVEETFDSIQNLGYIDSPCSNYRHSSFVDEKSEFMHHSYEENCDSDDSLGILPFDRFCSFDMDPSLETNKPQLKTFDNINGMIDEECTFLYDNQDFPKAFYPTLECITFGKPDAVTNDLHSGEENLNTTIVISDSPVECKTVEPDAVTNNFHSCEETLNTTMIISDSPVECRTVDKPDIVTNNFHSHEENLNTTIILSNSPVECRTIETESITIAVAPSPMCITSNVSPFTKNDDSPICNIADSPNVYASTPKHETNYSYVIEDDALCLAQNSSVEQLNKTISKKGAVKSKKLIFAQHKPYPKYTSPITTADENENLEENILNITCNLPKSLDINHSHHNKTLNNLNETCILPLVKSNNEPNINNKLNIHNQLVGVTKIKCKSLHESPKDCYAFDSDFHLHEEVFEDQIILNRTCDVVKISDSNTKKLEIQNIETVLNTTVSLPEELEDLNFDENVIMHDKTVALNTTFEKLEKPNLQASANSFKSSKHYITKYDNNVQQIASKSKSQNTIQFPKSGSLKTGSRNEGTTFDRKMTLRKSVGGFGKSDISSTLDKRSQRRSVGCFNTDNSNGASNKFSRNRNSFANNTCFSSKNSIQSSLDDRMSAKHFVPAKTINKALGNKKSKENLNAGNVAKDLHCETFLKSVERHEKNSFIKIQARSRPESLLNETLRIPTSIPDIGKTIVKKPKAFGSFYKSSEMSKLPKYKIESQTKIPYSEKGYLAKIFTSSENKLAQKSCKNTLLNRPNLKPSFVCQEEKHMETRPSEKYVLSQKNTLRCMSSGPDKLCKPQRATSGVEFGPSLTGQVPFLSRIPSISQNSTKQDIKVKSSLKTSGKECSIRKLKFQSQHNFR